MTEPDFNANFRNLLNEPLPPAPDPRHMAFELFQRDRQRTRMLAALSLLFWVLGTAGIFLLVFNLNRIVMEAQLHSHDAPHSSVFQNAPDNASGDSVDTYFHQHLPPIAITKMCAVVEMSVVALLIAALLTVALVFCSRQATLNRINLSLMQIAEQLSPSPPGSSSGSGAAGMQPGIVYSLPPSGGRFGMNPLVKLLIVLALLLLVGVPALWIAARAQVAHRIALEEEAAMRTRPWHGYPRLSPFEAVRWNGRTPQVQVHGTWYDLLAMNGVPADRIVSWCQALDYPNWQKRFEEDLVEVLVRSSQPYTSSTHSPGPQATLEVKDLETGRTEVLRDVPMTEANRRALWRAATTRPAAGQ